MLPVGVCSTVPAEPRARPVEAQPGVSNHRGVPPTGGAGVPAIGSLQVWRRSGPGRELLHCAAAGTRYYNKRLRQGDKRMWLGAQFVM